ncbi:hypothetical protein GX586_01065 [bacterium]|nr:hypothetical protein [bacterium]
MNSREQNDLILFLTGRAACGALPAEHIVPVLRELCAGAGAQRLSSTLIEPLAGLQAPVAAALFGQLCGELVADAQTCHVAYVTSGALPADWRALLGGCAREIPPAWAGVTESCAELDKGIALAGDQFLAVAHRAWLGGVTAKIDAALRGAAVLVHDSPCAWHGDLVRAIIGMLEHRAATPEQAARIAALRARCDEWMNATATGTPATADAIGALAALSARNDRGALGAAQAAFASTTDRAARAAILDVLCTWPTWRMACVLPGLATEPWAQLRAAVLLTLRFGAPPDARWPYWQRWLELTAGAVRREDDRCAAVCAQHPARAAALWLAGLPERDTALEEALAGWSGALEASSGGSFVQRWGTEMPAEVRAGIAGINAAGMSVAGEDAPRQAVLEKPEEGFQAEPSVLRARVHSFLAGNWFMIAGALMVVIGSSLVAYYTWDKHWLWRYTIMPALLALLTAGIARVGGWMERKDEQFRDTAAVLRAIAIGLVPVNMMAVALLARDPQVMVRGVLSPVVAAAYLAVAGVALVRWCRAVHPPLGVPLGMTLLAFTAQVVLVPVLGAMGGSSMAADEVLSCGFHGAFAVAVLFVLHALRSGDAAMPARRVIWFAAAACAVVVIEAFIWSYGYLGLAPRARTYALMMAAAGWLLLVIARRIGRPGAEGGPINVEAFAGYAAVLLGVLMGVTGQWMRIAVCITAAGALMHEAIARRHTVQYWLSCAFLTAGAASVGLLDVFPREWLAALGIGYAAVLSGIIMAGGRAKLSVLVSAGIGTQVTVLFITSVVAVLAQWQYRTEPVWTGAALVCIAALFALRAVRGQQVRWLHTAAVMPALALPYLGCVDIMGRTLRGNTLVFGLAVLSLAWMIVARVRRTGLVARARSTVLTLYGAFAIAAMVVRVLIEQFRPAHGPSWHTGMDLGGPLMITAALACTGYFTRSLLPMGMGAVIMVILFPEMKADLQLWFPQLAWGSGLGSAISAFVLVLACFGVRRIPRLQRLEGGDKFMDAAAYPLLRSDYSLFTIPVLISAAFLMGKVATWNVLRNLALSGVGTHTCAALLIGGAGWMWMAVYLRARGSAPLFTHLGWLSLAEGVMFGYRHVVDKPHWSWPVLATLVSFQMLYWAYRFVVERWCDWARRVLTTPLLHVLRYGSQAALAVCVIALWCGGMFERTWPLAAFLGAQMAWQAVMTGGVLYGTHLFVLGITCLLAWTGADRRLIVHRLSVARDFTPALLYLAAWQVVHGALEWSGNVYGRLRGLIRPALLLSTLIAALMALVLPALLMAGVRMPDALQFSLLGGILLVAARASRSMPFVTLAAGVLYLLANRAGLVAQATPAGRLGVLLAPDGLAVLAAGMAVAPVAGILPARRARWLFARDTGIRALAAPAAGWLFLPAALCAMFAVLHYTMNSAYSGAREWLWVPYTCAAACGVVAAVWQPGVMSVLAAVIATVANVHAVHLLAGAFLSAHGVAPMHAVLLGCAATVAQAYVVPRRVLGTARAAAVGGVCGACIAVVLVLIAAEYAWRPGMERLTFWRLCSAGAGALVAAVYTARGAVGAGDALPPGRRVAHAIAATIALWCAGFMIPVCRLPETALAVLMVPGAYFMLRARASSGRQFVNAAAVIWLAVLIAAFSPAAYHVALFPRTAIGVMHYHGSAPYAIVAGIALLWLHGRRRMPGLAVAGGAAVFAGSFFAVTGYDSFSPFVDGMRAAWCAIGLAHAWLLLMAPRSPVMRLVQRMTAADDGRAAMMRAWWRAFLAFAMHVVIIAGIGACDSRPRMIAPLVLGAASVMIHSGIAGGSRLALVLGGIELFVALHADFIVASYLPRRQVVWALLGLWALWTAGSHVLARRGRAVPAGIVSSASAAIVFCHILYHHPWSTAGLWAMAAAWFLVVLTPRAARAPRMFVERLASLVVLLVPVWLVFFSQVPAQGPFARHADLTWAVLSATVALVAVGIAARAFALRAAAAYRALPRAFPVMLDQCLEWACGAGPALHIVTLAAGFLVMGIVQAAHYSTAFALREAVALGALALGGAWCWVRAGAMRERMLPFFLAQLCLLSFAVLVRRHIMLTTSLWKPVYDVWASLATSALLTGFKHAIDARPRAVRVPFITTVLILPVLTMVWVLVHHMGSTAVLIVAGLHTVLFAYLGKDDRESPYQALGVCSFITFLLVLFWAKLSLRVAYAYVIPAGTGLLVLVQLFRDRLAPAVRGIIRFIAVTAMLGSACYYALIGGQYPVAHLAIFGLLCLGVMGLGAVLRIRLHLALGFAGLVVDLSAVVYKVIMTMQRGGQMIMIGGMVLLLGVVLVAGAVYSKTHRGTIAETLAAWRSRLREWE